MLTKRKYRLLFSPKIGGRPGPKGPGKNLIDAAVEMKRRNPTWCQGRYSARGPDIREVLQDAKAAVGRAKEAVSLQTSSGTAENRPVKWKKTAARNAAVEALTRKAAKKRAPVKRTAKKTLSTRIQATKEG
jgi:hypothetical protein